MVECEALVPQAYASDIRQKHQSMVRYRTDASMRTRARFRAQQSIVLANCEAGKADSLVQGHEKMDLGRYLRSL
jgi:hypothetical protein